MLYEMYNDLTTEQFSKNSDELFFFFLIKRMRSSNRTNHRSDYIALNNIKSY